MKRPEFGRNEAPSGSVLGERLPYNIKNIIYKVMKTPVNLRFSPPFLSGAGLFFLFIIWTVLGFYLRLGVGKPFPFPWEAAAALFHPPAGHASLFLHAGVSLLRWLGGFLLASVAGTVLGLVMGVFPGWRHFFGPLVTTLQLIPGLAWVPITLILFGLGPGSTIFMIAATVFAPVVISTRTGVEQIDPGLLRAAAMMELSPAGTFFRVILPGAAPSLVSGLRIGAANGFRVLISAEMVVGTGLGLGYSLYQSRWTLDYASSFAALMLIVLIGLVLERLAFAPLEARICRRRGLL